MSAYSKIEDVKIEVTDPASWAKRLGDRDYGMYCEIDFADRWARLMQLELAVGKKLEEIASRTAEEAYDGGLPLMIIHPVVKYLLSKEWKHGEELRRWYNLGVDATDGAEANKSPGIVLSGWDYPNRWCPPTAAYGWIARQSSPTVG